MRCYRLQMGKLRLREARDASEISQRLECPETKSGGRVCVWRGELILGCEGWGRAYNPEEWVQGSQQSAAQPRGRRNVPVLVLDLTQSLDTAPLKSHVACALEREEIFSRQPQRI